MRPNVSDMPLSVAFDEGIKLWQKMNAGSASQEEKNRAVDLLKRCHTLTEALALFSSNEQLEDISTGDLKYLLVPYYLADFQSSSGSTILQERVQIANEALQHYREFLDRCEEYDLLGSNKAIYQREEEGLPIDANTKRMIKVDRFKRQKAIDSHIATIESRRKKTTDGEDEEEGQDAGLGGIDEEDLRQLRLLQVEQGIIRALEARPTLKQEAQMLEMRLESRARATPAQREEEERRRRQEAMEKRAMLQQLQGIMTNLDTRRQQLQRDVFRPSFTPATITVEEAGEIELHAAMERDAAEKLGAERRQREEDEMDEEEKEDREVFKQRAEDDWKDDNPRGWGNSKLRPCA